MTADLESPVPQKATGNLRRPNKNVLVIEDDLDTATVLCVELIREGFGARHVSNRDEALVVLNLYIYDYIIMDYWMPGMSAKEFVQRVMAKRPKSKIVLTTAAEAVRDIAKQLGITCCLPKPIVPQEIGRALQAFDN